MSVRQALATTAARAALFHVALFCSVAAIAIGLVYVQTMTVTDREMHAALNEQVLGLNEVFADGGSDALVDAINERTRLAIDPEALYALWNGQGQLLAGNVAIPFPGVTAAPTLISFNLELPSGEQHTASALISRLADDSTLLVGRDVEGRLRSRGAVLWTASLSLLLVAAVVVGSAWWAGRRLLKRVDAVASTTARIAAGEMQQRLTVSLADDEFDRLSGAVNAMLERIEDLTGGLRTVIDSIAHDLRIPLMHARQALESAAESANADSQQDLQTVGRELETLQQVINALLHIAQAESGAAREQWQALSLADLARDAVELFEPVAEECGLTLSFFEDDPAQVLGHPQLLAQALVNLIDNAIKFSPTGSRISVRTERTRDLVRVMVSDQGPGIPEGERMRVQQRFVRLVGADVVPGSGLGLSLVAAIARLHRGRFLLEDAHPGLRAVLELARGGDAISRHP